MKELRKIEFTIEEYLNDPSAVLERAMKIVDATKLTRIDVQKYLEGRCRQMMLDSFSWDVPVWPTIGSGFMSCRVDGHETDFFVNVEPRQMSVSFLRDGVLLKKDIGLDPASSVIFTESPYDVSPISEYGLQKAKLLAADLYYGKY